MSTRKYVSGYKKTLKNKKRRKINGISKRINGKICY